MEINYLAILVCGVVAMIIGSIWYGPLFGKAYMRVIGADKLSPEEMKQEQKKIKGMYFLQFVLSLWTAYILAHFIEGSAIWSGKSKKMAWNMFLITASAQLVTFIVFGLILGAWN